MILFFDLETYCETDINAGTHRYAEKAEIMVFAYAFGAGPVIVWDCTKDALTPDDLAAALADPTVILMAHNTQFDRTILRHRGIDIPIERFRCTMAQAMAHALPAGLDQLGQILAIPSNHAKLKDGKALIQLFCKPRPKNMKLRRATRHSHPAEWQRFLAYAGNDIEALRAIYKKLPKWNYHTGGHELALWHLDQKINARGIAIDLELAHAAIASTNRIKAALNAQTHLMTDGDVGAATQRDALLEHIVNSYGVTLDDMRTSTVEALLDNSSANLPQELRDLLEVRISSSRSSTSKYKAMIKATSSDGRLRGTLQFCGATRTGRFAGRIVQPQNFSRVPHYLKNEYDQAIAAIKADAVDLIYDNPMEVLGSVVRGALVAPAGRKFVISDLSNIEGRGLAWEAGEAWKLQAFRDFDAGVGADLYKLAYAQSFGCTPESVTNDQRQVGKVMELACGFGGGTGAFMTFAATYRIDLDELADRALPNIPDDVIREATRSYHWAVKNERDHGLSEHAYVACDSIKRLWRLAHPEIVAWWSEVEIAAKMAVEHPDTTFDARCIKFNRTKGWLRLELPSGISICYPLPELKGNTLSYMGINQFNRKWDRLDTYSGKLVENATQAIARDVMTHNMPIIDAAGYEIVLSVHDELICETPDTPDYNVATLSKLLSAPPPWALDMPLAAAGFETHAYRKD